MENAQNIGKSDQFLLEIVSRIRDGERPITSARACGMSGDDFATMMMQNEAFRYAVSKAEADAQADIEKSVFRAALKDPKIGQEELKRRDPRQHNEKVAVERVKAALHNDTPDVIAARRKAEEERERQLREWKESAHLIEAGAEVIPIGASPSVQVKHEKDVDGSVNDDS